MLKNILTIIGGILIIAVAVALGMFGKIVEAKLFSIGFFW